METDAALIALAPEMAEAIFGWEEQVMDWDATLEAVADKLRRIGAIDV